MNRRCVMGMVLIFVVNAVCAQQTKSISYPQRFNSKRLFSNIVTAYSDSLAKSVEEYTSDSLLFERPTRINPYYYRLFTPVTLYRSVVTDALRVGEEAKSPVVNYMIPLESKTTERTDEEINAAIDQTLLDIYINRPLSVQYTEAEMNERNTFKKEVVKKLPRRERVIDLLNAEDFVDPSVETKLVAKKPNFWTKKGNAYLQFTQNYISSNWYKGGESNNTLLSGFVLEANYNDKQKVQWDNKLEWKLGFLSSRSDTLHRYKTNNDLIRLTSKLGLQAIKNWYYTLQMEFYTQFFASYKSNSPTVESSFMSPAYLQIALGMDYKRSWKNFEMSAVIAPLSSKMTYVGDEDVDETKFGLDEGKSFKTELGSNIQINSSWTIIPQIVWQSRVSFFTTYEKTQAEWENTFNFSLNRYLTTKLFVHARFDDGVSRTEGDSYFQLMELLSFGLSYNW